MMLGKQSLRRLIFCVLTGVVAFGATIQNGYAQSGCSVQTVWALAIDPSTPATLYAGTSLRGVFKSTNGGASWAAANTDLDPFTNFRALAIDPSTPATLYAGTASNSNVEGVYKSTTGGESTNGGANPGWTASFTGLLGVNALAIDPATPAILYVGAPGWGAFKSIDGGDTWTDANNGLTAFPFALAIDPSTPDTIYAGTSAGGVFKSTDGAASWQPAGALFVKRRQGQAISE